MKFRDDVELTEWAKSMNDWFILSDSARDIALREASRKGKLAPTIDDMIRGIFKSTSENCSTKYRRPGFFGHPIGHARYDL